MPEARASRIVSQIALALAAAHARGLVHRDLKPENIILRPDGYVKVLDFGLVKQLAPVGSVENLTSMAGLPVGTLRYMSPEQCNGEQATVASDIFGLGIIMHELVAGSHPFVRNAEGEAAFDVAHAIATEDPNPLTGTSAAYRGLVTRALSRESGARPSATAIAETLSIPQVSPPVTVPPAIHRRRFVQIAGGSAILTGTAAGLYFIRRGRRASGATEPGAPRILVHEGIAADPAFSPDGSTIAFAWIPPGETESHIYLLRDDGHAPTQLTFSGGSEREPCWSPDGSRIAFIRHGAGESAFYVIPARGGAERRIDTNPIPHVVGLMNWLSNDSLVLRAYEQGTSFLSRIDLETRSRQPISAPPSACSDGAPLVSPDRRWITFFRTTSDTTMDLQAVPSNATPAVKPTRLTFDENAKREVGWTPDSSGVVYHAVDSYFCVPVGGGSPRKIPALQNFNGSFSIRSSGKPGAMDIAIVKNRRGDSIWRASLASPDAGSPAPPTRFISSRAGSVDVDPALSPDGRQLAFLSIRSNSVEIWVTDLFGGGPTQLTSLNGPELYAPAWSPDGKHIVSAGRFEGSTNIFRISTTTVGSKPAILYRTAGPLSLPSYSPDGRWITFTTPADGADHLFRIPADGQSQPQRLTPAGGGHVHQYSADGEWIYFTRRRSPGLWRMRANGGSAELILHNVVPALSRAWQVMPNGTVYFAAVEPGSNRVEIRRFHPHTKKQERILAAPNPFPPWHDAICVSRDEQWILFPQREAASAQLLLAEDVAIPGA